MYLYVTSLITCASLSLIWGWTIYPHFSDPIDIELRSNDEPVHVFEKIFKAFIDPNIKKNLDGKSFSYPANESLIMLAVQYMGMNVIEECDIDTYPFSAANHFELFMYKHYKHLPFPNEMGNIFKQYATDKNLMGHNYVNIYHKYLTPYRNAPIRYLELGSLDGQSLLAFREYFPMAEALVGIDRDEAKVREIRDVIRDGKISVEVGDQSDDIFLESVNNRHGPFDIIIDDCSHIADLTISSFEVLFPLLNDGGLYIVEDMAWSGNIGALNYFFDLSRSLYRDRTAYGGDDNSDPWKSIHTVDSPLELSVDEIIFASSVVIVRKYVKHHWKIRNTS